MSVDLYYDAKEKHVYIAIPEDLTTNDITRIVSTFSDHDFETEYFFIDIGKLHNLNNISLALIYFLAGHAQKNKSQIELVDCNHLIRKVLNECNIYKNLVY